MPKETSHIHVKISPQLKSQFEALCDEDEITMSNKVRELIANLVRNRQRQNVKPAKDKA